MSDTKEVRSVLRMKAEAGEKHARDLEALSVVHEQLRTEFMDVSRRLTEATLLLERAGLLDKLTPRKAQETREQENDQRTPDAIRGFTR